MVNSLPVTLTIIVYSKSYALCWLLGLRLDGTGHGPQEACELTGNGRAHLHLDLAGADQVLVTAAEPLLGLPGDGLHGIAGVLGPPLQMRGLARREAVAPGGLGEHPPDVPIAGLRCPPRRVVAPLEDSEGTSPRVLMSCRGEVKRVRSPISATTVRAVTSCMCYVPL